MAVSKMGGLRDEFETCCAAANHNDAVQDFLTKVLIDQAHGEVLFGDRFHGNDGRLIGEKRRFGGKRRHAHGREDVDSAALYVCKSCCFDQVRIM